MRNKFFSRLLALAAAIAVVAGAALVLFLPPKRLVLASAESSPPTVVAGVSHIHTSRSDGTGTAEDVAAAAARSGLKFIILTDHGDGTRQPDAPQYRHGVLCLDAVEISTIEGHLVAVGMPKAPYPLGGEARDVIEDVKRLGGFGIVAHPDSGKSELQWREWSAPFDALEWLNGDSEWRDETAGHLARAVVTYLFRPVETLTRLLDRPATTLRRWDTLTDRRQVVALTGADAHARIGFGDQRGEPYKSRVFVRLPSYESMFSTFSMRVELPRHLSGDAAEDAASIVSALRAGRLYNVIDGLAAPPSFDFLVRSGSRQARMGESLEPDGPLVVEARSNAPAGSSIALFRNGQLIAERPGSHLREELPAARGVVRAEVRLHGVGGAPQLPWIVGNPVYVSPLPIPRLTPPVARTTKRLDDRGAERRWRIELQSGATGTLQREGDGPVSVPYTLHADTAAQSVALVLPNLVGVDQFDRISFRASADKPMRLSVQLRKGGGSEGQRWRRSVYLDETPRDFTVQFNELTPIGRTDTFRPELARVEDLLFVVDTTNTAPGTSGVFSIEAIRLER